MEEPNDLEEGWRQFAEKHPQWAHLSTAELKERVLVDDELLGAVNRFHDDAVELARKAASEFYDGPDRRDLWNFLENLRKEG